MATSYRKTVAISSAGKDGAAPYSVPISGDTRPNSSRGGKKLLDQFHDKMRSLHYALATEKCYRHWIVEFLHFHRAGSEWRHPAKMGKPEIEAFLTHLAINRNVSAKTQNQAFSAILFLYKQVLEIELPMIDAIRAKESRRLPVVLSQNEVALLIACVEGGGGLYRLMVELTYGAGLRLLECCRPSRTYETRQLPHAAPQFRDAFVGVRRRHSHGPGTSRPQGRVDDDDLHACLTARRFRCAESA